MSSYNTTTIADYLLRRLSDAGVRSVFGAHGDDGPLFRAVTGRPDMAWIDTPTERAAGEAADAYARLRGLGVTVTAVPPPAIMASPAPVVHVVARPVLASQRPGVAIPWPGPAGAARTDLRPATAAGQIDRVLADVLCDGGPVELTVPANVAMRPVSVPAGRLPADGTDCGPLTWTSLWAAVQDFLVAGDVLVTDKRALDRASGLALPAGARLIIAPYAGPVGWVGPAALGASLAAPDSRVVVLSSHRGPAGLRALRAQGLAPVVIWASEDGPQKAVPPAAGAVTASAASPPELIAALRAADWQTAAGRLAQVQATVGHRARQAVRPGVAA
jgi:hypothetical protein